MFATVDIPESELTEESHHLSKFGHTEYSQGGHSSVGEHTEPDGDHHGHSVRAGILCHVFNMPPPTSSSRLARNWKCAPTHTLSGRRCGTSATFRESAA